MLRSKQQGRGTGLQVVLYHHVSDGLDPLTNGLRIATSPALFEAHLDHFEREYDIVDLDEVLSGRLPRRPLLITFDDGYRSVLDVALPLLARRGLPSVFFLSAAFVQPESLPLDNLLCELASGPAWAAVETQVTCEPATGCSPSRLISLSSDLPYVRRVRLRDELAERFGVDERALRRRSGLFLDPEELPRLAELGCEIGNHTASHTFCRAIRDTHAAAVELSLHKHQLESWAGTRVRAFSYPYGNRSDATPFVEQALRDSGHEATFLVEARPNAHRKTLAWNRVSLDDRPTRRVSVELELLPRLRVVRDALAFR